MIEKEQGNCNKPLFEKEKEWKTYSSYWYTAILHVPWAEKKKGGLAI